MQIRCMLSFCQCPVFLATFGNSSQGFFLPSHGGTGHVLGRTLIVATLLCELRR